MGIHSFFSGMAFGVSDSFDGAIDMFLAIIMHKWSEALTLGVSFIQARIEKKRFIRYIIFYSFITPLGIILGVFFIRIGGIAVGIAKAISSGTFVYISTSEILVEEFSSKNQKF